MDKGSNPNRWAPLLQLMPGVKQLVAEKRREHGAAHVNKCWERGVLKRERGWFFALEGALAVGTPFDDEDFQLQVLPAYTSTQALLILRNPEVASGAH